MLHYTEYVRFINGWGLFKSPYCLLTLVIDIQIRFESENFIYDNEYKQMKQALNKLGVNGKL